MYDIVLALCRLLVWRLNYTFLVSYVHSDKSGDVAAEWPTNMKNWFQLMLNMQSTAIKSFYQTH